MGDLLDLKREAHGQEIEVGSYKHKHGVLEGRYELGWVLGQGNFARVYEARNLNNGNNIAIKIVAKDKLFRDGNAMTAQIKREISVMKSVKHPNIVDLYEVMATKSNIYLAMELVRGGDLLTKVDKLGKLDEDLARFYFTQLISAVDFCHSRGVYHRDLKLENLLLDNDHGSLKITDFGLSTLCVLSEKEQMLHTSCGTPHYVAPEVVRRKPQGYHGSKADIWSCGVILYVLLAGYLPFHDRNLISMYRKINKGEFSCPSWFSTRACDLITRMLDPDPSTRITIPFIMASTWYTLPLPPKIDDETDNNDEDEKTSLPLNAFHIISMSQGLDLSLLFEDKSLDMRFATTLPAVSVISRLEEVAPSGKLKVVKKVDSDGELLVRLRGNERGRKGRLEIAARVYSMSTSLQIVELSKDNGDTLEYNNFCNNHLRPALKDIVWTL